MKGRGMKGRGRGWNERKREMWRKRNEEWEEVEEIVKKKLRWSRGQLDPLQVQGQLAF